MASFLPRARYWLAGVPVAALLLWSSWQAPMLSSYARPASYVVCDAPGLRAGADSVQLQARVLALPGVTACAIRPTKQLLAVAYNPDSLSEQQLCQQLGLVARPPVQAAPTARQCPVPAGYVLALEKLRFALNLRRLWVTL